MRWASKVGENSVLTPVLDEGLAWTCFKKYSRKQTQQRNILLTEDLKLALSSTFELTANLTDLAQIKFSYQYMKFSEFQFHSTPNHCRNTQL